jgi:hypothetical protein
MKSYEKHKKTVENFQFKKVIPESDLLFVKKLNNEVKSTFDMLGKLSHLLVDEIYYNYEKNKGKESMLLKQFQNLMIPLIVRILDKLQEYKSTLKFLKNRNQNIGAG